MDRRPFAELLRLPTRRGSIRVLSLAVLIAVICWYFGVDGWHAILLGCAVTVAVLAANAGTSAPDTNDVGWRSGKKRGNDGSRNDVASLSWSLRGGWGLVGLTAERRLRQIARRRLALEGLDLLNAEHRPAIERRIGSTAYRILMRDGRRRLRMRTLVDSLDALDAVDYTYYPAPQPRSRVRGARRTQSSPREDP